MQSAYFSPGYIYYAAGLSWVYWHTGRIELGLVSGQVTRIRNQHLFETRHETELYGIQQGHHRLVDYGALLQCHLPVHRIRKYLYWEYHSRLFVKGKTLGQPNTYKLDLTNGIHLLFLKYLRLGLKTQLNYDTAVSTHPYVSHLLLFGFYIRNKL